MENASFQRQGRNVCFAPNVNILFVVIVFVFQKLAHAVLAEDFTAAEQILKSQDKVNIELKNLVCTKLLSIENRLDLLHAVIHDSDDLCELVGKLFFWCFFQGDMGATPLFYAILQNDTELVRLLCQHGAKVDSIITLEDEVFL